MYLEPVGVKLNCWACVTWIAHHVDPANFFYLVSAPVEDENFPTVRGGVGSTVTSREGNGKDEAELLDN
jgi:hypothetical protein